MEADFVLWEKIGNKLFEPVVGGWGKYSGVKTTSLGLYTSTIVGDKNGIFVRIYTGTTDSPYCIQKLDPYSLEFSFNAGTNSGNFVLICCTNGILCVALFDATTPGYTFFDTADLTIIKTINYEYASEKTIFDGEYLYVARATTTSTPQYVIEKISYETGEVISTSDVIDGVISYMYIIGEKLYLLASGALYELNSNDLNILRTAEFQSYIYLIGGDTDNLYIGSMTQGIAKVSIETLEIVLTNPSLLTRGVFQYIDGKIYYCIYTNPGLISLVDAKTLKIEKKAKTISDNITGIFSTPYFPYIYFMSLNGPSANPNTKPLIVYQCNNYIEKVGYKEVEVNVSV